MSATLAGEKARSLAPLQPARIGVLKRKYDEVRALARKGDEIVDDVVAKYSKQLDEFVAYFEGILDRLRDEKKKISDQTLQNSALRLPVMMYRLSDIIDRAAIEHDIGKAANKAVYAQAYLEAVGTIPDKEAQAELVAADEAVIVDLARHVHRRLQGKMDNASAIFDAIRKVMSARDTEKQVFRRDV